MGYIIDKMNIKMMKMFLLGLERPNNAVAG